ncbi:UDP-glucose 4-epimerase GalE [Shewanella waksmanii]|uniref:UDP-glucose 4-epimerase GalE n=1 Tax=Shewanella waksmanii TaxID=213783 RepID=UPI0037370559
MKVLVTGGAGYIGSHTCVVLLQAGIDVVVLDNLSNASEQSLVRVEQITGCQLSFVNGDVRDTSLLQQLFNREQFDAVIHFAGVKAVGESTSAPLQYYDINVGGSIALLQAMQDNGVKQFIFSSSATVYGEPDSVPIVETAPLRCTNPYGQSKLVVEHICQDWVRANADVSVTLLRYFNPIGAHVSGLIGEDPQGVPNNLMPFIAQVAVGKRDYLSIFGDDYDTPDGTGVRDYIHVVDLALGHLAALQQLNNETGCHLFNLGTGKGVSVMQMVELFAQISGRNIAIQMAPRRVGDISSCYACADRAKHSLNWQATRDLNQMIEDTWRWQQTHPNGYASDS